MSITRVGIAEKVSQLRSKVEDTARQNEATFRRCGVEAQRVPNYYLTNHLHFLPSNIVSPFYFVLKTCYSIGPFHHTPWIFPTDFTAVFTALHLCRAVLAMSEMSVCPSVRLSSCQTREL